MTHKAGDLAYIDAFAGLVPCKVLAVDEATNGVTVRVTAARRGWQRGEVLTHPGDRVVPRGNVRRRKYYTIIIGAWKWEN